MTIQADARVATPARELQLRRSEALFGYGLIYGLALLLSWAAATRALGVGRDYLDYVSYYNAIPSRFSLDDTRFEPAFHALAWSFKGLTGMPYPALAFVLSFVALSIKFTLMKTHLRWWGPAIAVYLCIFYPNHEYTQIRAATGLGLAYLAMHCHLDGKPGRAILLGLLGTLFHYSIVLPLAVFALSLVVRGKVMAWFFAVAIIVFALFWREINGLVVQLGAKVNPFMVSYALNTRHTQARPLAVNNILFYCCLFAGVACGWLRGERYRSIFTVLSMAAAAMMFIFAGSPEIAQRTKEVLFVAVLFAVFRSIRVVWDLIPVAFLCADAGLLIYLAFREHLLGA